MATHDACTVDLQVVRSGYDRKTCWVQTRAGIFPDGQAVMTSQKLRLSGSDIFYAIHSMHSHDAGTTWSEPVEQPAFKARPRDDNSYFYVSDFWPAWHAASGVMLGTGHTPLYRDDELVREPYPRSTPYSTYDPATRQWTPWRNLELPENVFFNSGSGCVQRLDLPNGEILLPISFRKKPTSDTPQKNNSRVTVLRCTFDGKTLAYQEHGTCLSVTDPRGLGEPSLAQANGRFFLTLRNDLQGYVAASEDGLHFSAPRPWCFDDGEPLGNYNTQQHWIAHHDDLYLVYTRRGADNDHVFRHRAPLFMAAVDRESLRVKRHSERIVVPERGARLGNFGIVQVSPCEAWVVVSEWMQTNPPNSHDCTVCERYGSANAIFISRIRWAE